MRPLDLPCGEQGKLPTAKAFKLAERDKHMSEQEKPKSFMQELDEWSETYVIGPLCSGDANDFDWETILQNVKTSIRAKVLESYRNGQQAGPRSFKQPPQRGGR